MPKTQSLLESAISILRDPKASAEAKDLAEQVIRAEAKGATIIYRDVPVYERPYRYYPPRWEVFGALGAICQLSAQSNSADKDISHLAGMLAMSAKAS